MKRILITSTDSMMYLFLMHHVKHLSSIGYQVDIACSILPEFSKQKYLENIRKYLPDQCRIYLLKANRNPFSLKNILGIFEVSKILKLNKYHIVWCNEPVIGFITRLSTILLKYNRPKMIYMAHGLHFFKNGPLLNYLFYPIELFTSFFTDLTIVINKTDQEFAEKYLPSKIAHIDGIGFNYSSFANTKINISNYKKKLGFQVSDFILISVGELNFNKNHKIIIESLSQLNISSFKYLICGVGDQLNELMSIVKQNNLENNVIFLGQRNDISQLLQIADVFVHPSFREGLGIAPLEAMASGLPIITSNRHGIIDYSIQGVTGYTCCPKDKNCFVNAIVDLHADKSLCENISSHNIIFAKKYDINKAFTSMESILEKFFI